MARLDFHAYGWTGNAKDKEDEGLRKPPTELMLQERPGLGQEFRQSPLAPLRTCDWLLKPASAIKATFNDPAAAVSWLASAYDVVEPSFAYPDQERTIGRDLRLENAADQLPRGVDLQWGFWLNGGRFATIAMICCPNVFADYACPQRT
ncbi:hypothetical protein [Nonomuraea typhae]|uniref:Uncharacterized protein n=1 Tax=Nonomuraea typhae TaxID=2603600 RepID=A0ABW7YKY6_9ACTN